MFGFGLELPFKRYGIVAAGGVVAFQSLRRRHCGRNTRFAASAIAKTENRATPQPRHHPRDCSAAAVVIRLKISF